MTPQQIEWIKSLDKEGVNGTIQGVLLRDDLGQVPLEGALKYLLSNTLTEKEALQKDNGKMFNALKGLGFDLNTLLID